jgi:hypothetical protein
MSISRITLHHIILHHIISRVFEVICKRLSCFSAVETRLSEEKYCPYPSNILAKKSAFIISFNILSSSKPVM